MSDDKIKMEIEELKNTLSDYKQVIKNYELELNTLRKNNIIDRKIIDNCPLVFIMHDCDSRVVSINKSCEKIISITPDNIIGKKVEEYMQDKQDLKRVLNRMDKVRSGGVSLDSVEVRNFNDDNRYLSEKIMPVYDSEGKVDHILCIIEDITKQKKNEIALKKNEKKYRLLAENVKDVIWTVDIRDLMLTYISPSVKDVMGYTNNEALKQSLDEMLTEDSFRYIMKIFGEDRKAIERGEWPIKESIELEFNCKGGSTIITESNISIMYDENNIPLLIVGVTRDIGNRKKMEEQLMRSRKMAAIGQLAGGIAHEINNPLAVIVGYTETLIELAESGELQSKNKLCGLLNKVVEKAYQCKKIIQGLIDFSQNSFSAFDRVDINKILEKIAGVYQTRLDVNSNSIILNLMPDLPEILVDRYQISQAFINILDNAIESIDKTGKIIISTKKQDSSVIIGITDSGKGISEENVDNIFDPFFTTKAIGEGTGLGLYISYSIIDMLNGDISVVSKLNKGSTFNIKIPVN